MSYLFLINIDIAHLRGYALDLIRSHLKLIKDTLSVKQ